MENNVFWHSENGNRVFRGHDGKTMHIALIPIPGHMHVCNMVSSQKTMHVRGSWPSSFDLKAHNSVDGSLFRECFSGITVIFQIWIGHLKWRLAKVLLFLIIFWIVFKLGPVGMTFRKIGWVHRSEPHKTDPRPLKNNTLWTKKRIFEKI
jgi:hypothetical protein